MVPYIDKAIAIAAAALRSYRNANGKRKKSIIQLIIRGHVKFNKS